MPGKAASHIKPSSSSMINFNLILVVQSAYIFYSIFTWSYAMYMLISNLGMMWEEKLSLYKAINQDLNFDQLVGGSTSTPDGRPLLLQLGNFVVLPLLCLSNHVP